MSAADEYISSHDWVWWLSWLYDYLKGTGFNQFCFYLIIRLTHQTNRRLPTKAIRPSKATFKANVRLIVSRTLHDAWWLCWAGRSLPIPSWCWSYTVKLTCLLTFSIWGWVLHALNQFLLLKLVRCLTSISLDRRVLAPKCYNTIEHCSRSSYL